MPYAYDISIYCDLLYYSDKNSKRARDMHLLKNLKITLKEHSTEGGERSLTMVVPAL